MNQHINALLGPLEAATRQGSWEDVEDIAREIIRLAGLERLKELKRIHWALYAIRRYQEKPAIKPTRTAPVGSQGAKTPLPYASQEPIKQGESTLIGFHVEQWPFG